MHPKRAANPKAKRPKVKDKQLDGMIKTAWSAGWWAVKCSTGHVMCYHPTDMEQKVLVNNTAGNPHVVKNTRANFRNAGLNV